ncbi:MAG: ATP-dependent sacrificial sulfur transferase LarE [Methanolinea sp.]|nr:ATP-dependent sacrificial sulfur transferase LarE [Methanolinea sp.]
MTGKKTGGDLSAYGRLSDYLRGKNSLLLSYSGGLDSLLLAIIAKDTVCGPFLCVFLDSPLVPRRLAREAKESASRYHLPLEIVSFPILKDPRFRDNPVNRCYTCKESAAAVLWKIAGSRGITHVADGVNSSDLFEFRPGLRAADDAGILHPLAECALDKNAIRDLARHMGLPIHDRPAFSCLATRVPYGTVLSRDILSTVEKAEDFLISLGLRQTRARIHGDIARIEVLPEDMALVLRYREAIDEALRSMGIHYVTLDLRGFRSGSMDEVITREG